MSICRSKLCPVAILAMSLALHTGSAFGISVDFQLLTWDSTQASGVLPSAEGKKPSAPGVPGDWLVFTGDDQQLLAASNSTGSLSHNFADLSGAGSSVLNQAPSLSGGLTIEFTASSPAAWSTNVTALSYSGQATNVVFMNQLLVTSGSPATQTPAFGVDGVAASGTWQASSASNWAFHSTADFYFATNADGDLSPLDVDATFDDKVQEGYLIPTSQLTPAGMAAVVLDDLVGFYAGDFEQYLLDEIAPRLPADATYLLVTQMAKTNPAYAEVGLPITTGSLIGNTTFAFTRQAIPEPSSVLLTLACVSLGLVSRPRRYGSTRARDGLLGSHCVSNRGDLLTQDSRRRDG